jgi:hypothetical protein
VEIILDADVIIRRERGAFDLATWAASRPHDRFAVAAITVAELCHGVERGTEPHKSERRKYLDAIVAALPIIPYTEQTAYGHTREWADFLSNEKDVRDCELYLRGSDAGNPAKQPSQFRSSVRDAAKSTLIMLLLKLRWGKTEPSLR